MNKIYNKVVLITGSNTGIGKETAFQFAKEGCKLVITYYKDKNDALEVSKKCLELGATDVLLVKLDISNSKSVQSTVKKVISKFKSISILINNAGVLVWKPFNKNSHKDIEFQIRTNLEGTIKMTRECLPYVKDTVITVASMAGKIPFAELSTYCATKFGLRGFTQSLAKEIPNLKFYSVNPGATATKMTNFQGVPAEKVAEVILRTAKERSLPSGADVDVWEILDQGIPNLKPGDRSIQ